MENYIRFDWAMKRLLRNKANYAVLEGLLTTLLEEKVTIHKLLESESKRLLYIIRRAKGEAMLTGRDVRLELKGNELFRIENDREKRIAAFPSDVSIVREGMSSDSGNRMLPSVKRYSLPSRLRRFSSFAPFAYFH